MAGPSWVQQLQDLQVKGVFLSQSEDIFGLFAIKRRSVCQGLIDHCGSNYTAFWILEVNCAWTDIDLE